MPAIAPENEKERQAAAPPTPTPQLAADDARQPQEASPPGRAGETMYLPSRGEFYKGLLPDGALYVRPLTYDEEDMLGSTASYVDKLNALASACVALPKGLTPGDLLSTDRVAMFLWARVITFGSDFSFQWSCPQCRQSARVKVDIRKSFDVVTPEKVRAKLAELDPPEELSEPWYVTLPNRGDKLGLRFLRGKDEAAILTRSKQARMVAGPGAAGANPTRAYSIAKQIVTVNGTRPAGIAELENYVRQDMTARDRAAVRISTERRETGIDTHVTTVCRGCGYEASVPMSFDAEFFQPAAV